MVASSSTLPLTSHDVTGPLPVIRPRQLSQTLPPPSYRHTARSLAQTVQLPAVR